MKLWEKNIRRVEPYVPGEQPKLKNMIKINTNENPYPPALGVQKALNELEFHKLKLYPDPTSKELVDTLAKLHCVESDQVFTGVGSDDVLAMAFLTFFNSDQPILFPDVTYSFYEVWSNLFHISYERPLLDHNFRIMIEDYIIPNGGIIIANPNAPTSIYEPLDSFRKIIENNQTSIVIIDEAYIDFGGESAIKLVNEYDNLLVVQTFSKSRSMAGMRIGYAIGNCELIQRLNDVKYSFNSYTMNLPSLVCGVESLKDPLYFDETIHKIIKTREIVMEELKSLGFDFPDSYANFIFATHKKYPAKEIFLKLKEKNIFVRYFDKPRIDNYLRISIGTEEEMQIFIRELKDILRSNFD